MKLLLINPKFPENFWSQDFVFTALFPKERRTLNPPLGLTVVAALTPEDWEVDIIDENVESIPLKPDADIIGVTGMNVQFQRQKQLLRYYQRQGYFTVAGGSFASLCPELFKDFTDTIVVGEAERTWKEFCLDFKARSPQKVYQEKCRIPLSESPVPRYDLLKMERYQISSLQFSRGCSFNCEFCDIPVILGRGSRSKSPEQIIAELELLRQVGTQEVFFADDNLIGNIAAAKNLLRQIIAFQKRHNNYFRFGTQVSLNVAYDDELLQLLKDANFDWLFIGIETPEEESLRESGKNQNLQDDLSKSINKIYSYGLDIFAGLIVGFDSDTIQTFEKQYQLAIKFGIQNSMITLLTALPKTPLYYRLKKEGRLNDIKDHQSKKTFKLQTNVIPKKMSYQRLIEEYRRLFRRLFRDKTISQKIINKMRILRDPIYNDPYSGNDQHLRTAWGFIVKGLILSGPSRIFHFLRSLPYAKRNQKAIFYRDWAFGIATRKYLNRHFCSDFRRSNRRTQRYFTKLRRQNRQHLKAGALSISLKRPAESEATLQMKFRTKTVRNPFTETTKTLKRVLKRTYSQIRIDLVDLDPRYRPAFERLINRLAKYGERVSIFVDPKLRDQLKVEIDSSLFNLILV